MKGVKIANEPRHTGSSNIGIGNTHINVEFNMPVSMVKIRCEKENVYSWMDSKNLTKRVEEDAFLREQEKKRKLEEFQKKTAENAKNNIQKKKEEEKRKQEEKEKEHQRIMKLISRPRILPPPKKSPRKKKDAVNESHVETEEFEAIEKEIMTKDKTLEEISNLTSTLNPETANKKNELIRMKLFSQSRANTTFNQSSFLDSSITNQLS